MTADLVQIANAVQVLSPTHYLIQGELRDISHFRLIPAPGATGAAPAPSSGEPDPTLVLLTLLETELYNRLYMRPSDPPPFTDPFENRDFIGALSKANVGTGAWERGWKIVAVEDDEQIAVARDNVTFWTDRAGIRTEGDRLHPGAACRVKVGKEIRNLMPSFYVAIGDGGGQEQGDTVGPLVRLYWNLTPGSAVRYIGRMTERLGSLGIPFRTKVASEPQLYRRADAGVLYLERRLFPAAQGVIREIQQEIGSELKPDVPMFTKRLAPGLGLAEDPGNGLSFGISRCKLVAQGLWAAYTQGDNEPDARHAALAAAFHSAGLDPTCPYLEPGSQDPYDLA